MGLSVVRGYRCGSLKCKQVIITYESVISRELSVDLNKWYFFVRVGRCLFSRLIVISEKYVAK